MTNTGSHPQDLGPYLDGDTSDRSYEAVSRHLDICPQCRDEVREWRAMYDMFRSPADQIDVPAFQWQRISAKLKSERRRTGFLGSLLLTLRRPVWGVAAGLLLTAAAALTGLQYRRHLDERQLSSILAYSRTVETRLETAGNPFGEFMTAASDQNPFEKYQEASK